MLNLSDCTNQVLCLLYDLEAEKRTTMMGRVYTIENDIYVFGVQMSPIYLGV